MNVPSLQRNVNMITYPAYYTSNGKIPKQAISSPM